MGQVKIQESKFKLKNNGNGKIAIFLYAGEDDPIEPIDKAVSSYVKNKSHIELIDINMDNPRLRIVISGINEMKQEDFDSLKHQL